ncbi:TonB-dependent receptor domain-containing protein [Maricaulis sp.]|uniref:TonB-dependent receptor domain-containing protein n=1 Tax=Maricaulis sp. TaxID=1486257 RepID=UPI003A94F174
MSNDWGRGRLLRSTILAGCAAAGLGVAPALAQDVETIPAEPDAEASEAMPAGERITVTGSRIRRNGFDSEVPLDVYTADDAALSGVVSVSEFLQNSTVAAGSSQVTSAVSSQFVSNGGSGVETVSLRGLGANRTLVLLNGRRAGPAGVRGGVSSFDLNVLPLSVIDRVEVLKDGASSLYGSDAVAGVVNIITRQEAGGSIDAFASVPQDGAGEEYRISGTYGWEFERGFLSVTLDAYSRAELAQGDRDYFNCGEAYVTDSSGARADVVDPTTGEFKCEDLLWGHVWVYDYNHRVGQPSNLPRFRPNYVQYDYTGSLAASGLTPIGTSHADPNFLSVPDDNWYLMDANSELGRSLISFDHPFQDQSTMVPETERYSIFIDGHYEVTDDVTMFGEVLLNRRETYVNSYRQYWIYSYNGDDTLWGVHDPFAVGWGGFQELSPTPITDHNDSSVSVDYMRLVAGLEGENFFGLDTWTWDFAAQFSRSEGEYWNQRIFADAVYDQYYRTASCLGTVSSTRGAPCVDVNWLDPELLRGNITDQAVRDYIFGEETGSTIYEQLSLEAVANGEVMQLPAGPMAMAVGLHYREDSINDTPGEISLAGNIWGQSTAGITQGSDTTQAVFAEFGIPLLAGVPLAESLSLTLSGRYTDVSSYGSGTTYKAGLSWVVNDQLMFRATQGTSFRTPALFELYLSDQTSYLDQRAVDICIDYDQALADGAITQTIRDNCAADVPDNNLTGGGASALIVTGGGFGVLEAETSDSLNLGFVWSPNFANFRLSVDYFEIEIANEVSRLGAAGIITGCYSSENFATEPLCDLFDRNSSTDPVPYAVAEVRDSFININSQVNRGVDVSAEYGHEFSFGDLNISARASYQLEDTVNLLGGTTSDSNGEAGDPKLVGNLNFNLVRGDWTGFWGMRYVGPTSNREQYYRLNGTDNETYLGADVDYKLWTESVVYHDLSAQYANDDWSLRLGVANVFDEHPPAVTGSQSNEFNTVGTSAFYSQYDWYGRRFFVNLVRTF